MRDIAEYGVESAELGSAWVSSRIQMNPFMSNSHWYSQFKWVTRNWMILLKAQGEFKGFSKMV